ncbi:L-seryl-tRNA selenium transferase [Dethiosulfovibrio peptidovorans DSM 11002]|uniref:L-seryl-tRNA(Sec) selenium transferase n=1 Tax=Dethiosulfovibrio peptidovorans DSM 11002 TaxID=469381 RepID=D2Z4M8_9BACT|nr:L-seryl-tRNA(Sec) selenium transferase [Dethiosulfovibrio peptidovorans]EFC92372.1 L-seryl-tRNA selenium transferase [Dethiosulfovibrio peptidovorans DSM 11002]
MTDEDIQGLLRGIPAMEKVLNDERASRYLKYLDREGLKELCSSILNDMRVEILSGKRKQFKDEDLFSLLDDRVESMSAPSLRSVVNGTGVVVHTNLGRSCLSPEAVKAVSEVAGRYNTLEYDLEAGERGQRNSHVEWLLCKLTGAEAAVVVNNNAGAVLLCLAALSAGRSAVVSRGELVEIGGSFRIPDIMTFSGTRLVEVGTTNRTHLRDYERAVGEDTAIVMKVHPSNFRVVGFHKEVSREDLAALAEDKGVIFMEDLGSGILVDPGKLGLSGEPTVGDCIDAGVDLVTFSGDKLLGGPQIGAVVGKKKLVDSIRTYPLLRALRCDKMTLAALEATLRLYLRGNWNEIPTLAMLSLDGDAIKKRCLSLMEALDPVLEGAHMEVVAVDDAVGGGAFPATAVPGFALSVSLPDLSSGTIQERLRSCDEPAVVGARDGRILIHGRTLMEGDLDRLVRAFTSILEEESR